MAKAADWLEFWGKVGPAAIELGQELFRKFEGDTTRATQELRRIKDHGIRLEEGEAEIDRDLAELRAEAEGSDQSGER